MEGRDSEIFAATVSSSPKMETAASTQLYPAKKLQKTILVVKPASPQLNEKQGFTALDDAFASLKLYVSKLNPSCPAFFQKPKARFTTEDIVNKLGDMMKIISKGANLSQVYTNHSVRASAITVLSDANVPDRHIMFVSGHSSEESISHYSARPSAPQLESVSDTISNTLQYNQTQKYTNFYRFQHSMSYTIN